MEQEFGSVIDALPDLVWSALPDGSIDSANRRWYEYTGIGANQTSRWNWQSVLHIEDVPKMVDAFRSPLVEGKSWELEARLRRFDGAYRWFLFRACPMPDASNRLAKWCGVGTDIEDRRRVEEELRASERRYRLIVDGLPAVITLMTPDGELDFANRRMLDYFGATLEELKARPTTQSFHPDDRPEVDSRWKKCVETGCPYDHEARLRGADGEYRWFHTRGFPIRDEQGHIVLWHLLQTDVDDRKRAEFLLEAEKRLLETVALERPLEVVLDELCRLVEETTSRCFASIVLVDSKGACLRQGSAPSLPASFINSIVGHPLQVESGPCAMAAALGENIIAPDLRMETRWASSAWPSMAMGHGLLACWATPILSAAGKVLGAFAIYYPEPRAPTSEDQSLIDRFARIASIAIERVQKDASLKQSEALLAETQRLTLTGGFLWNVSTGERTWSREVYRIYGLDPSTPATIELSISRVHPEDAAAFREMRERQLKHVTDYVHDYRIVMPDGAIKFIHSVGHVTTDPDGDLVYSVALQDVTERHRSEEVLAKVRAELAHVARASSLGALTASIAHEVNQPLSGIITNASTCLRMLALSPPNVDGALETARRTIRDANRASDVITRLRALFAKKETVIEALDLNEAARDVIALTLSDLQRRRMVLRQELAGDLPLVEGDRVQLQQVILNLLLNSADAMSEVNDRARQLLIRTERDATGGVRLSVKDAGVGLGPLGTEKLFEPFYTTKSGGMGIGLAVSRTIIESHQGRLWGVANDGPGATFSFFIPIASESIRDTGDHAAPRSDFREIIALR
jgi:PAS domain S-box-containing protein